MGSISLVDGLSKTAYDANLFQSPFLVLLVLYFTAELVFFFLYIYHFVPCANCRKPPDEYRDYGQDRLALLRRILNRIDRKCRVTGQDFDDAFQQFLIPWFNITALQKKPGKKKCLLEKQSSSSTPPFSSCSSLPSQSSNTNPSVSFYPCYEDMKELLSWAFFGKYGNECVKSWEKEEIKRMFHVLQKEYSIRRFSKSEELQTPRSPPRRFNLDPVHSTIPRPLAYYAMIWAIEWTGHWILRRLGFRRYHVRKKDIPYWYRPSVDGDDVQSTGESSKEGQGRDMQDEVQEGKMDPKENELPPLIFFHGIAPAGITFCIPMIINSLLAESNDGEAEKYAKNGREKRKRAVFLFENRPISSSFGTFTLPSGAASAVRQEEEEEDATVREVLGAVDRHVGGNAKLSLCGHSFGSCPITWLLRSTPPERIEEIILLDPVTILLSNPDVMVNFLYRRGKDALKSWGRLKIYMFASTELGTERHLRRRFSWYNSELWLEDVPDHVRLLICLSGNDEILDADKVRTEILLYMDERAGRKDGLGYSVGGAGGERRGEITKTMRANVQLLHWPNAGHASCITRPAFWKDLREALKRQRTGG